LAQAIDSLAMRRFAASLRRLCQCSGRHFCTDVSVQSKAKAAARPLLLVPGKGKTSFELGNELSAQLQKSRDIHAQAIGPKAALTLLQMCALAEQELKEKTGFIPNFGRLAMRVRSFTGGRGSETFLVTVSRLLDLPQVEGRRKHVTGRRGRETNPEVLGRSIVEHLQEFRDHPFGLQLVGEAAAYRALCSVWWAQKLMSGTTAAGSEKASRLVVIPEMGSSLSPTSLQQFELKLAVALWTRRAVQLPPPPPVSPKQELLPMPYAP